MLHSDFLLQFGKEERPEWKEADAKQLAARLMSFWYEYDPYASGTEEDRYVSAIDTYLMIADGDVASALSELRDIDIEDVDELTADDIKELEEDLETFERKYKGGNE